MSENTRDPARELTRGQITALTLASLPMAVVGGFGGWGTFTNINSEFNRSATAAGAVAAGEGVTLVLALVLFALTLFGQSAPLAVRAGLWLAPLAASAIGTVVADSVTETVVYALTPLGMSASAEGLGLLLCRTVVYSSGTDMNAARDNAATMRLIAYHQARSRSHPSARQRRLSESRAWNLMERAGLGDTQLGAELVDVQRAHLTSGARVAMTQMLGATPVADPLQIEAQTTSDQPLPPATPPVAPAATPVARVPEIVPGAAFTATPVAPPLQLVKAPVALLSVADVASLKGVSAATVRSWVRRDKLVPATRDDDGRLWFHPDAVSKAG